MGDQGKKGVAESWMKGRVGVGQKDVLELDRERR